MSDLSSPAPPSGVEGFWAVIPAGGAGTRLWPLSRASSPKFLHDLTGHAAGSLLQATWDRLAPLTGDRVMVVTGVAARAGRARAAAGAGRGQPARRAVAAGLDGRDRAGRRGPGARATPDAVIGSFAADHVIGDAEAFRALRARGRRGRPAPGYVVTIGIEPTHPATGFGYIHVGDALQVEGAPRALAVREFVEKPDAATAGGVRWPRGSTAGTPGMFVVRASVLLDLLATLPARAGRAACGCWRPSRTGCDELWPALTKIAIDHAVAEPAAADGRVAVVPGDFGWDDVGRLRLARVAARRRRGRAGAEGPRRRATTSLVNDARGLVVPGSGRTVAVLGLDDVVVVDTPDAVLVTTRARAQEVKSLVDELKGRGRTDLT